MLQTDQRFVRYAWVDYKQISAHLPIAVIAAEDQNFPKHWGFDLKAIDKALQDRKSGGRLRGASTLSQQLAKNLFLWPGRSLFRKGLEAYFTLLIEALLPKKRILALYLNVAQFGPNVFGVSEAAKLFFKKEAIAINADQAARMAAILPKPRYKSLTTPDSYLTAKVKHIQNQVRLLGGASYLTTL